MFPHSIILLFGQDHVLMGFAHGPAFVVVGSSEDHGEEVGDEVVKNCNITHILKVEDI